MTRFLILLIIFFALYHFMKKWLKSLFSEPAHHPTDQPRQHPPGHPKTITDQLVKDPVCGVYCPKKESVTLSVGGKDIYFCSTECRNKFLEHHKT